MNWREKIDPTIKMHLEKQIAESVKDRRAYESAPTPGNAQLWVAIANLSKDMFNLNLKLKSLEGALKQANLEKRGSKKTPRNKQ